MNHQKHLAVQTGLVLGICLLTVSFTAIFLTNYYNHVYFQWFGGFCQKAIEAQPEMETPLLAVWKEYLGQEEPSADPNIFSVYGYPPAIIQKAADRTCVILIIFSAFSGGGLFLLAVFFQNKKNQVQLKNLTEALEKVNTEGADLLMRTGEGDFSKLQDEIYKTVTALYHTRDAALKAKNNFAENLSNIAHQLKTPITSISLALQMFGRHPSPRYLEQIRQQLARLTHLEESLLLLSRVEAGTLFFEKKETDVFTLLVLAADCLQELFSKANVSVEIPELGEVSVWVDLGWTVEAVGNLLKNCMEHTPSGGKVYCCYEQNPLYTQIRIWDTGDGFARGDLPHIFERFYRGRNEKSGGIGIGLTLAKAIIEQQNGTVRARNLEEKGACFEIRIYRNP